MDLVPVFLICPDTVGADLLLEALCDRLKGVVTSMTLEIEFPKDWEDAMEEGFACAIIHREDDIPLEIVEHVYRVLRKREPTAAIFFIQYEYCEYPFVVGDLNVDYIATANEIRRLKYLCEEVAKAIRFASPKK